MKLLQSVSGASKTVSVLSVFLWSRRLATSAPSFGDPPQIGAPGECLPCLLTAQASRQDEVLQADITTQSRKTLSPYFSSSSVKPTKFQLICWVILIRRGGHLELDQIKFLFIYNLCHGSWGILVTRSQKQHGLSLLNSDELMFSVFIFRKPPELIEY